ncbi:hypothetical protein HYS99_01295 [Candidatus Giovannonibacteria bacterium]|nr:hypothetical protein [Candidatus Giovannonibacteria bacterium]
MQKSNKKIISDIIPLKKEDDFLQKKETHLDAPISYRRERKALPKDSGKIPPMKINREEKKRSFKFWFLFLILALGIIAWKTIYARMEISISPKTKSFNVNKQLNLSKEGMLDSISFGYVSVPVEEEGIFNSSSERSVEKYAKGIATIFNKQKDAQVLVASTRLESPAGKIYRISKTITIPGSQSKNEEVIPGSKEVEVTADKPGEEYNSGLTDFTLPALAGSPKFKNIFGRSKTEITGGSQGKKNVVSKDDVERASSELLPKVKARALDMLKNKIPAKAFLLNPTVEFAALANETNPPAGEVGERFTLKLKGEARGVILDRRELEKALYEAGLENSLSIKNLDALSLKIIDYKFGSENFKVQFNGKAESEAVLDADEIKTLIQKKQLKDPISILAALPDAVRAEVRFNPFWYRRIPTKAESIDIVFQVR